jgi:hypothetical protein
MALIKLGKRNEAGQDVGAVFINTDHIVAVTAGQNATEVQTADTRTHWVKETADQVAALTKT